MIAFPAGVKVWIAGGVLCRSHRGYVEKSPGTHSLLFRAILQPQRMTAKRAATAESQLGAESPVWAASNVGLSCETSIDAAKPQVGSEP